MTSRMRGYVRVLRAARWLAGPLLRGTPARLRKDPDKAFAKQFGDLWYGDAPSEGHMAYVTHWADIVERIR